ncbi:hypothetical protein EVAR_89481_1 [Eumeta japonica]|uniref:Uncharacterized protein n=1 Tax=Eumeta variegata TaxID=151549 RepID=A0A4C1XL15_EUMVA|nr:hypothetical protein EVAR_89481_1 [Eumeta japonica]
MKASQCPKIGICGRRRKDRGALNLRIKSFAVDRTRRSSSRPAPQPRPRYKDLSAVRVTRLASLIQDKHIAIKIGSGVKAAEMSLLQIPQP